MKPKLLDLSRRYRAALCAHLRQRRQAGLESARGLGARALAAGLQTLDLAKLHEQILVAQVLPGNPAAKRDTLIKQAGAFFAAAITPIEKKHRSAREATAHLKKFIETLSQRTVELAASNLELSLEIIQRKVAEEALKKSERHYTELLAQSDRLQEQLRLLSRQILSAQEDERKKISRELHDVIAQTLTGINVRLAALKKEAALNTTGIDRNIARTQRLVEKSVNIVHQFARELRPAVLDDLGLIPALHSFMKHFTERTGVRTHLTAFAGVEQLDTAKLHRVFSRRPGSLKQCRPACARQPCGREHPETAGLHLPANTRRWKIFRSKACDRLQVGKPPGSAWHEGAPGDGWWQIHRRIVTRQRHNHPGLDSLPHPSGGRKKVPDRSR